jgi:hypothetical protein
VPKLSCWSCGRQIYTVAPLRSLFEEERRCPRCGAFLHEDRRETERRWMHRRVNPMNDPGPPKPKGRASAKNKAAIERRVAERRTVRRRGGSPPPAVIATDPAGWQD